MPLSKLNATAVAAAFGLLVAGLPPWAAAQTAGLVLFVKGEVQIHGTDGALRPARKGETVLEGERLVTGGGAMAQVKLSDGGYVGLRAESGLRFEPSAAGGTGTARTMELTGGSVRVLNGHLGVGTAPYMLRTPQGEVNVRGGDALAGVVPAAQGGGAGGTARTVVRLNRGTATAAARSGTPLALGSGETVSVSPAGGLPQRISGVGLPQLDAVLPPRGGAGARAATRELPTTLAAVGPAAPAVAGFTRPAPSRVAGFDLATALRGTTPLTSAEPTLTSPSDRLVDPNVLTAVTTGRLPGVAFPVDGTRTLGDSLDAGVGTILSTATGSRLGRTAPIGSGDPAGRGASLSGTIVRSPTLSTATLSTVTADPRLSTGALTGTLSGATLTRSTSTTTATSTSTSTTTPLRSLDPSLTLTGGRLTLGR